MATSKSVAAKTATPKAAAKSAPKKAIKKAPVKKASSAKKTAGRALVYADNDTSFWVVDGQILNSLVALRDALAAMDKNVYAKHVTGDKNDFANWVGTVLDDAACARDLLGAKTPTSAKTVVVRHLKLYSI